MNFEQMEYIKEVVETKSMSLAAHNLHVSQSAISQSISLLEKEIGIKLFKRSRFGTTPTEEGKNIIKKVLEILKKVDEMKGEVQAITSSYKGELKIATISSLFLTILPKSLSRFKKDFPQIKMTILEMESKEIIEKIEKHEVDLGFLGINADLKPKLTDEIAFQSLHYQGGIKVIVPQDSPLAFYKELTIKDIIDYPFVMYASRYWENLSEYIQSHFGPINIMFATTNTEVIKRTVAEGLGISLLSSLMLLDDPYVESQRISSIPLADYSLYQSFSFGWIHSKSHPHSILVKKFIEYIEG
ncbi:LysR family transcriptional regulator [Bacillus marasmi]|uniref:LysR family transcriptional regulator n=1 Tax=Bacillus marasmi TaxID=1926279 RepID=UPI0011C9B3DC|nr:LysR family transcriptional regulator [Bacillus marasmi]